MVKHYCMKIYNHEMTIEEVPALWRKKVQAAIDAGLYKPGHIDAGGDTNAET